MRDGLIAHAVEGALGGAFGTLFTRGAQRASRRIPVATGLRWSHGVGWGLLLGVAADRLERRHLVRPGSARDVILTGAAVGAAAWALGYSGILPALGLARPVDRRGAAHAAGALLGHLALGALGSLPILLAERYARPAPRWRRALSPWRR